jgi:hypothetical protein
VDIDIAAAASFAASHARIIDRLRLDLLLGVGDRDAITDQTLAALEAYGNTDGGYGWGLEPDLRSHTSQPGAALCAFEVWADIGADAGPRAQRLCDWLASISLPDGGVPFALPFADQTASAPWWTGADSTVSSLQITAAVVVNAHKVAVRTPAVASHPWLQAASQFCFDAIRALDGPPPAHILSYSLQFLDAVADTMPQAADLIERLVGLLPPDGNLPVEGGAAGEMLRPLVYAPEPGTAVRSLLPPGVIEKDLERLTALQQADGGWPVDWAVSSPAAALEWRGYVTVRALALVKANGQQT